MDSLDLTGRTLGGTYRITRLLGRGGMGAVFEAVNDRLGRSFAIKALLPAALEHPQALPRFRREARIATELGHPHIIDVVDFNETNDGVWYMVMEFLEGEDLASHFAREGQLALDRTVVIALQVCAALSAAHDRGIVHRDLKPANVFLQQRRSQRDFVKVVDFGISKVLGSVSLQTQEASLLGTPNYMAPEQAQGINSAVGPQTDVFALGAILYEALAGRSAFQDDSLPTLLFKIVYQDPPPLGPLRPDAPPELIAVVERALAKEAAARFADMRAMAKALRSALPQTAPALAAINGLANLEIPPPATNSLALAATSLAGDVADAPRNGPAASDVGASSNAPSTLRPPRSRLPLGVALTVAVCGAAAGGYFALRDGPQAAATPATPAVGTSTAARPARPSLAAVAAPPAPAGPPASQPAATDSASAPPSSPPATRPAPLVRVELDGSPATAVYDARSGQHLGTLPLVLQRPRGSALRLRVARRGYRPKTLRLVFLRDRKQRLELRRFDPDRIDNPYRRGGKR